MLTADMKQYRRDYYRNNRDYLLAYSKWYYKYCKFLNGQMRKEELEAKPLKINKEKMIKNKKVKKEKYLSIEHGEFYVYF